MATDINKVWAFFKDSFDSLRQFSAEWNELSEESKTQIRSGIINGSLTY